MSIDKYILLSNEEYQRLLSKTSSHPSNPDIRVFTHTKDGMVEGQVLHNNQDSVAKNMQGNGISPPPSPNAKTNVDQSADRTDDLITGQEGQVAGREQVASGPLSSSQEDGNWFDVWESLYFQK